MSSPTAGDVHVNVPLTNMSLAYIQDQSAFIADQIYPNIPVVKQSDRYWVYSRADFNRDEMEERAPGTESAGGGYDLDNTPNYFCPVYGYHKDISDQIRNNTDMPLNPDRDATIFVSRKALIRREVLWAKNHFAPGKWASGKLGVDHDPAVATQFLQWNVTGSTPIEDIRDAKRTVLEATGFEPNVLVLGKAVYDALVDHAEIIERVKFGQTPGAPAKANESTLSQIFELDKLLVSKAVYNTGAKGANYTASAANETMQFIAGNHALLAYVTPTPGLMIPSAGYTFSWNGWMGATPMGFRIKQFRIEAIESDRTEIQMAFSQKQVATDLGFFFESAINNPLSA